MIGWLFLAGCGTFIEGVVPGAWETVVVSSVPASAQVVDARDAESYANGHIPGAANVHWTELTGLNDEGLWDALPPDALADLLAERGLSADEPVVIYGSGPEGYGDDGNLYWTLKYLGHSDVQVLDGGWLGYLATGGQISTRSDGPPPRATFATSVQEAVWASTMAVEDWEGVILDVRSEAEWLDGHIPGAVWMEWTDVFDEGGVLRSPASLEALFTGMGIDGETPVVVYCAGGIRAGHTFMVLDALGQPAVSNYVGSWARWTAEGGERAYP
ncbi:MAG: rhodanese-like domain-containing protein [Myxococcota bacterium]